MSQTKFFGLTLSCRYTQPTLSKRFDCRNTFTRPFGALWSHALERKILKTFCWCNIYTQAVSTRTKQRCTHKHVIRIRWTRENVLPSTFIFLSLLHNFPRHPIDINTRIFVINFSIYWISPQQIQINIPFPTGESQSFGGKKRYALNMIVKNGIFLFPNCN